MPVVPVEVEGVRIEGFIAYVDIRLPPPASRVKFGDADLHHRPGSNGPENRHDVRHPGLGDGREACKSDPLGPALAQVHHRTLEAFHISQGMGTFFREMESGRSGVNAPAVLLEQHQASLPRENTQVLAHGGRREMQTARCSVDGAGSDDGTQNDEAVKVKHLPTVR